MLQVAAAPALRAVGLRVLHRQPRGVRVVTRALPDSVWLARVFYVWISVFNLFVVSVAWSLMADVFRPEQAKRLFAIIAAGASAGGLTGPCSAAGSWDTSD
jgi:AAA family ATP:ADP antiporter